MKKLVIKNKTSLRKEILNRAYSSLSLDHIEFFVYQDEICWEIVGCNNFSNGDNIARAQISDYLCYSDKLDSGKITSFFRDIEIRFN